MTRRHLAALGLIFGAVLTAKKEGDDTSNPAYKAVPLC